jgi:hypothetical protein
MPVIAVAQQDGKIKATLWEGQTLVADINCADATISDRDRNSFSGEIRGCDVTYYTQPRAADEVSQKVNLHAGAGTVDGKKKTFSLRDRVAVKMADGSRIETRSLHVDYPLQTLTSDQPVSLTRQNATITGTGMRADDTLRQVTILKDGSLEIAGEPRDLVRTAKSPPAAAAVTMFTRLRCAGPLSIRDLSLEIPGERRFMAVDARDGVRIEREEQGRKVVAHADTAVIYVSRVKDEEGRDTVEPVSMTLRGNIRLADGQGAGATADTADWNVNDDLLRLHGAPHVEVIHAGQRVRSRSAVLDRWSGTATFRGELVATLALPGAAQSLDLCARELEIEAVSLGGQPQPSAVVAVGDVRVRGEAGAAGKIDATGTRFVWNAIDNRGVLTGEPFAKIVQGESVIESPEVAFEGRSMFVVKGPKRMHLVQLEPPGALEKIWGAAADRAPGRRTEIRIRCAGDVAYDGGSGTITLLDRCEVVADGVLLSADRLFLKMSPAGGIADVRGQGRVKIERDGMRFSGDTFRWLPEKRTVEIRGEPHVFASVRGLDSASQIVRLNQETGRIESIAGPGGGKIRVTRE